MPATDVRSYLQGHDVYNRMCVPCHGRRGRGDGEWAKASLEFKPRDFRSGVFKFRSTPAGFLPTKDDLRRTIRNGISGTAMPAFKKLTDAEVDAVIVFLQSFSPRWRDPERHAKPVELPELPGWYHDEKKKAVWVAGGRTLFGQHCVVCHGGKGKGDGPGAKGLKDEWGNDIVPADLSKGHHKSGDTPQDLYRTIALGLDGTPMAGFGEALEEVSIWSLVAYIESIEAPAAEASGR